MGRRARAEVVRRTLAHLTVLVHIRLQIPATGAVLHLEKDRVSLRDREVLAQLELALRLTTLYTYRRKTRSPPDSKTGARQPRWRDDEERSDDERSERRLDSSERRTRRHKNRRAPST